MFVSDIYGKDKYGKHITIKTACYRAVDKELLHFRRKIAHNRQIDFGHNKRDLADPHDTGARRKIRQRFCKRVSAKRCLVAANFVLSNVSVGTLQVCSVAAPLPKKSLLCKSFSGALFSWSSSRLTASCQFIIIKNISKFRRRDWDDLAVSGYLVRLKILNCESVRI